MCKRISSFIKHSVRFPAPYALKIHNPGLRTLQACQANRAHFEKMSRKKQVLEVDSTFSSVLTKSTKQQIAETKQARLHLHFAPQIIKIH